MKKKSEALMNKVMEQERWEIWQRGEQESKFIRETFAWQWWART